MITIKNGGQPIYYPQNPSLMLINPRLTLEDNGAGSLRFQIYENNLNYGTVKKLYPLISVIRDGRTIFKGRVISDKRDFYNGKIVEAEGKLAFFNDSYMEPFSFSGSPAELFRMVIESHNAKVKEWQQFKVGEVTVADKNDYIVRGSENIINSWDALKEKCFQSSLGGHIRIRYEDDGDYVDWLADYNTVSRQHIEFAKNMLDISSEVDATETYTAIRPVGAEVDGSRIGISSVNGGRNYLVNEEKAGEYGIIYAPESESTWQDVTLPANLLKKAEAKLYHSFALLRETYEIKAVDLHLTDKQIEALNIYEYVPVVSKPHGIDDRYLLYKADIDITSPQNTVYYLGATKRTLSDVHGVQYALTDIPHDVSAFRNDANYVSEEKATEMLSDYPKTEDVEAIVSQEIGNIPAGADGLSAYEIAVRNGFSGNEEEWILSLKGEKGQAGQNGVDGARGRDGLDGLSAYEVAVENGFRGNEREWLSSLKGEKGEQGKDGEDGQDGKDGSPGPDGLSAYELAVKNGFSGTEQEWIESLGKLEDATKLPLTGGTLMINDFPDFTIKRKSGKFSSGMEFANESRELIQLRGGLENNDLAREAYFSLYDLDSVQNGTGKLLELLHVSQNLRNIYDNVTKSMKKILVDGEALPAKDGTVERYVIIRTGAFPQLRLGRTNYGESVGIELLHGNVSTDGKGIVLEAWRESEENQDINFGIRNRVSGKSMMIVKSSNSEINSVNRHPLILRNLNEDKTNSVDIRFRVGSVWTNQLCSAINGEMFFWDSVHEHFLFTVSESKRQIYDYKTKNLQEVATKNDLDKSAAFQPGETFAIKGDTPFGGYLTTSSTTVYFTVPLPRAADGREVSVSGNFRIRKNGGYLVEGDSFSNYLVTTRVSGNLLAVDLKKKDSGKFSEENNIIIMVDGSLALAFS